MNEDQIRIEKIKFIDENKEILKNNLLTSIIINNENITIIHLLMSILLSEVKLNKMVETEILKGFLKNKIIIYKEENALYDIFGTMKLFIMRIYNQTEEGRLIMDCLNKYNELLDNGKNKILVHKMA